ncbi:putative Serine/threonine-protein kinase SMG1, partial [Daphnia magna]
LFEAVQPAGGGLHIYGSECTTEDWINQTEKYISDKILASKDRMNELVSKQSTRVEELHELNPIMRSQLAVHHQLLSDVHSVLKSMAKCEMGDGSVSHYLEKHRQFSECCSSVPRRLATKDYHFKKCKWCINMKCVLNTHF